MSLDLNPTSKVSWGGRGVLFFVTLTRPRGRIPVSANVGRRSAEEVAHKPVTDKPVLFDSQHGGRCMTPSPHVQESQSVM